MKLFKAIMRHIIDKFRQRFIKTKSIDNYTRYIEDNRQHIFRSDTSNDLY